MTEDKDFGELTFRLNKPNKGIVLIRLSGQPIEEKVKKVLQVLNEYLDQLADAFTVISKDKVRIRKKK